MTAAPHRETFARRLLKWHTRHGRHDLPWQHPRTAYRVWVAEVMLQQTQVATVIPYYRRFLTRFPDVAALARAPRDALLARWSGLGYYARARNLHEAARQVVGLHGGEFPADFESVAALPGIGRSTAGAILAQAFGARYPILEGNARRVFARHKGIAGWPGEPRVANQLWRVAERQMPVARMADYTQALMDLGATVCTARAPRCVQCPVSSDCVALKRGTVARLPTPRPRRERPRRTAQLLLIENARGHLLLERRPDRGIWGGLWCPPMVAGRNPGARVLARLPAIHHAFTHYDLELQPVRVCARRAGDWVKLRALSRYGIPAPVRKLLLSFPRRRESSFR
ncbi:MAG: A/G-specific adenine glycosylase [Nevskiaceae bacterium]